MFTDTSHITGAVVLDSIPYTISKLKNSGGNSAFWETFVGQIYTPQRKSTGLHNQEYQQKPREHKL